MSVCQSGPDASSPHARELRLDGRAGRRAAERAREVAAQDAVGGVGGRERGGRLEERHDGNVVRGGDGDEVDWATPHGKSPASGHSTFPDGSVGRCDRARIRATFRRREARSGAHEPLRRHALHGRGAARPGARGGRPPGRADAPAVRRATSSGQAHLFGPNKLLARALATDRVPSMILWGPPGRREDDARPDPRRADEAPVRAVQRRARIGRRAAHVVGGGEGEARVRGRADARVRRRDPPVQQVAAGRVPPARRERDDHAHRRDDREPFVRGERGAPVALQGVPARGAGRAGPRDAALARARRRDERPRRAPRFGARDEVSRAIAHLAARRRAARAHDARARGRLRRVTGGDRPSSRARPSRPRRRSGRSSTTRPARSTTTSSARSSNRCAAPTPTPPSTG